MYVTTFSHAGVDGVSVVAYNPLGQASSPWLRLPVSGAHWQERKTPQAWLRLWVCGRWQAGKVCCARLRRSYGTQSST